MLQTPPRSEILAVWRDPFSLGSPQTAAWKENATVLDMVAELTFLPDDFLEVGVVIVDGKAVPTENWDKVIPQVHEKNGEMLPVTLHYPMQGGGGGVKRVFSLVAAVALAAASYGIATGAVAATTSATIGTTFGVSATAGASLLAAGVSLTGALVLSALSGPPVSRGGQASGDDGSGTSTLSKSSLTGNVLEPNASIPRVIGTRRVYPPFAYEPVTEVIGQDEFVSAAYVLAGPHKLEDIRVGLAALSTTERDADVVIHTYDGLPDSDPITIPNVQGRTFPINVEMSVHGTNPEDEALFQPPLPVYHGMVTADKPDQSWLHIMLVGLIRQSNVDQKLRVPFRVRMRKLGDPNWRYLPEFHYMDNTQAQKRLQVKFIFGQFPGGLTTPRQDRGFVEARKTVPGQNVSPTTDPFTCDPYFSAGAGNDIYRADTVNTTNVTNMTLEPETVTFYLDPAEWEPGQYDVEIKRGATFINDNFVSDTYMYSGSILDFYFFRDNNVLPLSREGLLDRISLIRFVSVRYRAPIRQENLALIQIRARNRSVERLSVLASGYVRDYNGVDWNTVTTTSNPAAHYRDVMVGPLNYDPIPEDILDLDSIENWHARCAAESQTCDMVVESQSVFDTLRIIAACGYARPYQSEVWGVIQDYNRAGEAPVQTFTSRNSNNMTWKKAFPRLPSGFRINYSDRNLGYDNRQVVVYRNQILESDARLEQTTYDGITDRQKVIDRAKFDLKQGQLRSAIYTLTTSAEILRCRKGSLVAVNHEMLSRLHGSARISEVLYNDSGLISGVILDADVQVMNTRPFMDFTNFLEADDFLDRGLNTGVTIRRTNGQFSTYAVSNDTGEHKELNFSTPFADDITDGSFFDKGKIREVESGCLVAVGELQNVSKRYIVAEIDPSVGLSANVTLMDEAPELWS